MGMSWTEWWSNQHSSILLWCNMNYYRWLISWKVKLVNYHWIIYHYPNQYAIDVYVCSYFIHIFSASDNVFPSAIDWWLVFKWPVPFVSTSVSITAVDKQAYYWSFCYCYTSSLEVSSTDCKEFLIILFHFRLLNLCQQLQLSSCVKHHETKLAESHLLSPHDISK